MIFTDKGRFVTEEIRTKQMINSKTHKNDFLISFFSHNRILKRKFFIIKRF